MRQIVQFRIINLVNYTLKLVVNVYNDWQNTYTYIIYGISKKLSTIVLIYVVVYVCLFICLFVCLFVYMLLLSSSQ